MFIRLLFLNLFNYLKLIELMINFEIIFKNLIWKKLHMNVLKQRNDIIKWLGNRDSFPQLAYNQTDA